MKKGFSLMDILIIIGLILLTFLVWQRYFKINPLKENIVLKEKVATDQEKEEKTEEQESEAQTSEEEEEEKGGESKEPASPQIPPVEEERDPRDPTLPPPEEEEEEPQEEEEEEEPACPNGIYENKTYYYSISCPTDWPLKIRNEENISLGTVPPKDGWGAITIEIPKEDVNEEIESIKAEAGKYPGVSIKEETIVLAGVVGNKVTLDNSLSQTKNIYIILEKNNVGYLIKYSHESSAFVAQVEDALETFKFTN